MTGDHLNADIEQYLQALSANNPPPQIISDRLVTGSSPVEQLLKVLGLAANLSDQQDNTTGAERHAERDAKMQEAARKFAAQDEAAAAELNGIAAEPYTAEEGMAAAPDPTAALAQQLPQLASGIAGALAGAVGGALQPLAQLPQQAAQGIQQALQTGMGLFQQAGDDLGSPVEDPDVATASPAGDWEAGDWGSGDPGNQENGTQENGTQENGTQEIGAGGGADFAGGGAGLGPPGGTAPTSHLGPPPIPSAGTVPSSAPITPITPPAGSSSIAPGAPGMTGMPMVPPGAMTGTANTEKDTKADTKRVSVPPVRNGAPVQGRLTVPPPTPPVVTKVDGKPVVTRRVVAPNNDQSGAAPR